MSWVARKIAGLDNDDQQTVIKEYFEKKSQMSQIMNEQKELDTFWKEYAEERYDG